MLKRFPLSSVSSCLSLKKKRKEKSTVNLSSPFACCRVGHRQWLSLSRFESVTGLRHWIAVALASVSRTNLPSLMGYTKTGAETSAFFSLSKALWHFSVIPNRLRVLLCLICVRPSCVNKALNVLPVVRRSSQERTNPWNTTRRHGPTRHDFDFSQVVPWHAETACAKKVHSS